MTELPRIAPTTPTSAIRPVRPPRTIIRDPRRKREHPSGKGRDDAEHVDDSDEPEVDTPDETPRAGGSINLRV